MLPHGTAQLRWGLCLSYVPPCPARAEVGLARYGDVAGSAQLRPSLHLSRLPRCRTRAAPPLPGLRHVAGRSCALVSVPVASAALPRPCRWGVPLGRAPRGVALEQGTAALTMFSGVCSAYTLWLSTVGAVGAAHLLPLLHPSMEHLLSTRRLQPCGQRGCGCCLSLARHSDAK